MSALRRGLIRIRSFGWSHGKVVSTVNVLENLFLPAFHMQEIMNGKPGTSLCMTLKVDLTATRRG